MGADESSRRIKFAYQMEHWSYEGVTQIYSKLMQRKSSRLNINPTWMETYSVQVVLLILIVSQKKKSILPMGEKHSFPTLELTKT